MLLYWMTYILLYISLYTAPQYGPVVQNTYMVHHEGRGYSQGAGWAAAIGSSVMYEYDETDTLAEATCPSRFVHHGDTCYNFIAQQISWIDAKNYCHINFGAHLATIQTADTNTFITSYLHSHQHRFFGYDFWLGSKVMTKDEVWKWSVGENSAMTFTNWFPGQPDAVVHGMERCLELEASYDVKWNDDDCDDHNYFICERPYDPPVPSLPGIGRRESSD